jgi:hypothetical protein
MINPSISGVRIGSARMLAQPRTKGIENYQTVSVACAKCDALLFRYKKKNGVKSNLIKCYVERMCALLRIDPRILIISIAADMPHVLVDACLVQRK